MKTEVVEYAAGGQSFKGYLAYDSSAPSPLPCILIAHAWRGQDDFARKKAEFLAELGYAGFAVDLYGDGKCVSNDEAPGMMMPLFVNRKLLRERILAAYYTAQKLEAVDGTKMAAIGFCFGGLTVIELLRSGVKLKGIVSFHGLLGNTIGENRANAVPPADKLHGSLLILHGYKDPMVSIEDIENVQKEFSTAGLDWQMHIYGRASHAFTNPIANDPEGGMVYDPISEQRSMRTMINFFSEILD